MAKAMGLIFFTFQRRFSPSRAFWNTAVRTIHSLWTYQCPPLCPIHLADSEVLIWWYHHMMASWKLSIFLVVATLITDVILE